MNQKHIDNTNYDYLKNIARIYRQSKNHENIDFVLNYLEADLRTCYNKPNADIAADFRF